MKDCDSTPPPAATLGLRIDVDTFRGTRLGVPGLCDVLGRHNVRGTFFFSVGPDNMGRNLWRMLNPTFAVKMLRTKAASLYGWDILLRGTFGPGPIISKTFAGLIRETDAAGHEIGLHAWDHYRWQNNIDTLSESRLAEDMRRGCEALAEILGRPVACAAAPAWKCNDAVLRLREQFPFAYNSDTRGRSIFRPRVDGRAGTQPQIPVTLPTYDELLGRDGVTEANFNETLLARVRAGELNVLTIHAEVEGIVCAAMFDDFLTRCREKNIRVLPLGELLDPADALPTCRVVPGEIPGRSGWGATQNDSEETP